MLNSLIKTRLSLVYLFTRHEENEAEDSGQRDKRRVRTIILRTTPTEVDALDRTAPDNTAADKRESH